MTDMTKARKSMVILHFFSSFFHFSMKKEFISGGIDVSSEDLHMFLRREDESGVYRIFANTNAGIKKMVCFLQKHEFSQEKRIVLESTGRYHALCAYMLSEENYHVCVINPMITKKYNSGAIRKTKTDKMDAKILAEVAEKEKGLKRFSETKEDLLLRQKISLVKSLEKTLQKITSSLQNYQSAIQKFDTDLSPAEQLLQQQINEIKKQKEKLEREIINHVFSTVEQEQQERVLSIPGVSPYLAALILSFFSTNLGQNSSAWVSYCGMDISANESGKYKGKSKLSKRGNRYLRKRLYSGAWGAVMNYEIFRKYYDVLRNHGRLHKEALNIIARKILRTAHSLLKNKSHFSFAS